MKKLFELMQCFDYRGEVFINQHKELIFKHKTIVKDFVWDRVTYDEASEYDFDIKKAPVWMLGDRDDVYETFLCYNEKYPIEDQVLSSLSRPAHKEGTEESRKWILDGINKFLGTNFDEDDIKEIYMFLGNGCNQELRKEFVKSNYYMKILKEEIK